jgi:hypothetical protein
MFWGKKSLSLKKNDKNCAKQFLNVEIAQRPSAPPLRPPAARTW